jgi:hypothetical protein
VKITFTRLTKDSKVLFTKTGTLKTKITLKVDLVKTIFVAYNGMLKNPDCHKVAIILEKEVK